MFSVFNVCLSPRRLSSIEISTTFLSRTTHYMARISTRALKIFPFFWQNHPSRTMISNDEREAWIHCWPIRGCIAHSLQFHSYHRIHTHSLIPHYRTRLAVLAYSFWSCLQLRESLTQHTKLHLPVKLVTKIHSRKRTGKRQSDEYDQFLVCTTYSLESL